MKQCPRCGSTYTDDTLRYCLTDGSALSSVDHVSGEPTLVLDQVAAPATQKLSVGGVSPVFKYLAIALAVLMLLMAGAGFAAWKFWVSRNSQLAGSPTPTPVAGNRNTVPAVNGDPTPNDRPITTTPSPTPSQTPRRLPATDPGTTRITFKSGSVGEILRGSVAVKRVFVLRTLKDQRLTAVVSSSKGCVVFDGGGKSTEFTTSQGDSYLTIRNDCDEPSPFSLSVTVR